jgi:hypothetical protein
MRFMALRSFRRVIRPGFFLPEYTLKTNKAEQVSGGKMQGQI